MIIITQIVLDYLISWIQIERKIIAFIMNTLTNLKCFADLPFAKEEGYTENQHNFHMSLMPMQVGTT